MSEDKQIIKKAKELLDAIGENHFDLWDANLNDTHSCIIFDGGDITTEYEEGIKTEFKGIYKQYYELNDLIKKEIIK